MEHQRLRYLLDQYIHRKATAAEIQELNEVDLKAEENSALLSDLLAEGFSNYTEPTYDTSVFDNLDQRALLIDKDLQDLPGLRPIRIGHRIHFLKRTWLRYAAAVIIMLGAGAYLWTINHKTDRTLVNGNKQLQADIPPGGERAILTLADGRSIALDSAAHGQIGDQGGVKVLKMGNGQIAYDLRGLHSKEVMWNTVSTPKGGQYQVTLPDGTRVWLNASSSITFPTAFVAGQRHVKITGEIYFEVEKNKQQPFFVDVEGRSSVQVLGTSFNINSYGDDDNIKTTLLEGSVKVIESSDSESDHSQSVVLKPGQQAALKSTTGTFVVTSPDIEQILAWKNGIFDFTGADLKSVMKQLERWYDIKVQYNGSVPKMTFEGKMYRNVNFSGVLEMLNTMDVKFRMEGKTLIVL